MPKRVTSGKDIYFHEPIDRHTYTQYPQKKGRPIVRHTLALCTSID